MAGAATVGEDRDELDRRSALAASRPRPARLLDQLLEAAYGADRGVNQTPFYTGD